MAIARRFFSEDQPPDQWETGPVDQQPYQPPEPDQTWDNPPADRAPLPQPEPQPPVTTEPVEPPQRSDTQSRGDVERRPLNPTPTPIDVPVDPGHTRDYYPNSTPAPMPEPGPPPQSAQVTPYLAGAGQVGPVPNPGVLMGFDLNRFSDPAAMGTLKYYIGQLLSAGISGADAVAAANQRFGAGSASWDAVNGNIGLDKTRDGYIGYRPFDRNDPNSAMGWQWMAYNNEVQPPGGFQAGDINSSLGGGSTQPGVTNGARTGGSSAASLDDLLKLFGAMGQGYGGPGTSGVYANDYVQQVGQDPLSQLITGALAGLVGTGGAGFSGTNSNMAQAIEAARMPYEIARKSQLANARAELANRGTLGEPGQGSGLETDAISRIEQNLAPAYTAAIDDRLRELDANSIQQSNVLVNALRAATDRQSALSDIALRSLEQNRLWNQFLATYGLDRDKALYEMATGQNQNLLLLLQQFLSAANTASGGYI